MKPINFKHLQEGEIFLQHYIGINHTDVFIAKYVGDANGTRANIACNIIQHFRRNRSPIDNSLTVAETFHHYSVEGVLCGENNPNSIVTIFRLESDEILAILSEQL